MTDENEPIERKLLEILEEAIAEEAASADRYRRALKYARDEQARSLLERLVKDELAHEQALKERYYQIKKRLGLKVMKDK
ncbi:MAG: hypothetical protein ACNS63_12675 [Candidatus Nitrospinota bacterium M3_3B_026]